MKPFLGSDGVDLVGRNPIREDGVEAERGANRLGRVGPVARHHDDPRHACGAQSLDSPRGLTPQLVRKQQSRNHAPFNGNENAEGGSPGGPSKRPKRPLFRPPSTMDKLMRTGANLSPVDNSLKPGAHCLTHLCRDLQREAPSQRGRHNGSRRDVLRSLLERGRKPQRFIGVFAGCGLDGDQPRSADC
jgi:hypothetical protein